MKQTPLLLSAGLFVGSAMATEAPAPSIDLLLYIAEWEPDRNGYLVDPLEVPDEAGRQADAPLAAEDAPRLPAMEYSR